MNTMTASSTNRTRLGILVQYIPAVAGSLALGAGLTVGGDADAALVIRDINLTADDSTILFDLDQDGSDDYRVIDESSKGSRSGFIESLALDDAVLDSNDSKFAVLLEAGTEVNAALFAAYDATPDAGLYSDTLGPWAEIGTTGFVGLRLDLGSGNYSYGWVEITRGSATVNRVGYQTTANAGAPIPAVPAPGTLALLAVGAAGIAAARRRKQQ